MAQEYLWFTKPLATGSNSVPDEVEVLARRVDSGEDGHEAGEAGEQPAQQDHARHALKRDTGH